jgi:site-specific recombinase XerC
VPLNALVRQVIEEWLSERHRRAASGERAFFLGRGGRRLAKRSVDDVIRGLGEDAGVKLSAHIASNSSDIAVTLATTRMCFVHVMTFSARRDSEAAMRPGRR